MNIKEEINRIKVELDKVEDPDLIAEFKRMLRDYGNPSLTSNLSEERIAYAKQSEIDILEGNTYTPEEAFAELVKRIKK